MTTDYRPIEMATQVLQSALVLLDAADEPQAALHVQQALCALRRDMAVTTIQEADRALDTVEAQAIIARWT